MYNLDNDLGLDWILASYFIEYVQTVQPCDFHIPEVNLWVRAFRFDM